MALLLTMMICFNLVCILVIGIMIYLLKKRRPACVSSMASTSTDIVSSSSSMASTSTDIVSSSSFSTSPQRYDVFLSFYGNDTRYGFSDHLHNALQQKGLSVFRDVEKLERGKYISDELPKAIQQSKCGIAVISKNYAFSKWCLDELAEMVKCPGLRVFPIFYQVNPSDIRKVRGTFAEAFDGHEKDPKVDDQMMSKWRAALREVSNMSGWHLRNDSDRYESNVIKEICNRISDGLRTSNFSFVSEEFVGIKPRVEEIMALLSIELDKVLFLGIWGMGGIGKTTLSKAIYEEVSHKFDASCFIEETRSLSVVDLQKHLISHILKEREIDICNPSKEIRSRLRTQKVFIVLDDVDGEKLEALAKRHDWFGQGSRIIITSRDQHLLSEYVDKIYEVKLLNDAEALKLFSLKVFKKPHPEKKFEQLYKEIVNYADGLPLAINVFGKLSRGRELNALESVRDLLRENPNAEILDRLKISYHGLENSQQNLFLDIACFFNGAYAHKQDFIYKLEALGCYPNINLNVLVEKSLITISKIGILGMHDLLQKMGQKIVHDESAKLGKRSRLWREEDVIGVLKNDSGTDAVRGIVLKLPLQKKERIDVEAFSKMKNLKMLEISGADLHNTNLEWHGNPLNFMSNELCIMEFWGYPFKSLPENFQFDNLVVLKMPGSCIEKLWIGKKSFKKLKHIDLSDSQNLIETPDLGGVPNLEKLKLADCTNLSMVHPSIGRLKRFKELHLGRCKQLKCLSVKICLETFEILNLYNCSILDKISDSVGNMTSLQDHFLDGTAIKELSPSSKMLSSLEIPHVSNCSGLKTITKDLFLSSLERLDLSYCNLSDGAIPSDLSCLSSLKHLWLSGNKFTRIPDVAQLSRLFGLLLEDCISLQALPKLPLGLLVLSVRNCPLLELFDKQMEIWTSNGKLGSIDCSFIQACIGFDGKPFKILHLDQKCPLWSKKKFRYFDAEVACGPALVESGIPEWFNDDKSTNWDSAWSLPGVGCALFIIYEFHGPVPLTHPRKVDEHGNSNSTTIFDGSNSNLPNFLCHFQLDGVDVTIPLVFCAPGVPSVGPNRFWMYIPIKWLVLRGWFDSLDGRTVLEASITTSSLNVKVKECGMRVVRDEDDASEFCQVLKSISPHALDSKSYENFFSLSNLEKSSLDSSLGVTGPIIK